MNPQYFLFDIGNVLMNFDFNVLYNRIAADSGRPPEPPNRADVEAYVAVEEGRISDDDFLNYLNRAKGLRWRLEDYIGVWSDMFSVNPVGHELFRAALERGVPVCTLSNIAGHHLQAIQNREPGFFDGVHRMFLSFELGVRKPAPGIYQQVLDALQADPGRCFFIDDRPENVAAARAAGMDAHHFVPERYDAVRRTAAELFFDPLR